MRKLNQAIILAGGLGTRLRPVVDELPKCLAPVAGRPFLFHVVNRLRMEGIEHFIFSLGYKHERIENYLEDQFPTLSYQCSIEQEPLGTGGAIRLACQTATDSALLVVNGDTLFEADIQSLYEFHGKKGAECSLALKPMREFDRYGIVETDRDSRITHFREKQFYREGLINGGVYIVSREMFLKRGLPALFSFEKDYLEKYHHQGLFFGKTDPAYFIDIGIPEDYLRAQLDLAKPSLDTKKIDKGWTLFLDRDGVINHDKVGSYIFNPGEFVFYDGARESFGRLAKKFGRIIVVTNQRGVGRQLMTPENLEAIHDKMKTGIEKSGGRLDAIFFATAIDKKNTLRKPNPGMAILAKRQFPGIDFSRSIMVGNNPSDMQFGRNTGMYTVFLRTTRPEITLPHPDIDLVFDSLEEFSKTL